MRTFNPILGRKSACLCCQLEFLLVLPLKDSVAYKHVSYVSKAWPRIGQKRFIVIKIFYSSLIAQEIVLFTIRQNDFDIGYNISVCL